MAQNALYQRYTDYYQKASALYQRPQVKASLEIILSVFTVTLLIFFAIRPTLINVASLQKKIEDQEVVLKKINIKLGQLIRAEQQLSENRDRLQLFSEAVPNSLNYFNISKRVEILARENLVNLEAVRLPGSVVSESDVSDLARDKAVGIARPDADGLMTIPVSFSIEGGQPQILGFLRGLENMDMLAVVKSIRIAKQPAIREGLQPSLGVDGTAWFYTINSSK